ncbi:MAG: hypothetical protein HN919_10590 [Verrucomicrobia bacterium]|jgi:hypothetical protein|nr:hypothetical protein [Verrucomicrobiota bacterium]MBT7066740.1 hypothetical protein [Verrucomicrobiota bacterium]MBT7701652.1 hypothetical protein [Verrucomicrobiota bacterium]
MLKLNASPRLYVTADSADNLKDKLHSPYLQNSAEQVIRDADWLVRTKPLREDETKGGYQSVTRPIDTHLQCLTAAWVLTHEKRYRRAAIKHLGNLVTFNQISCEANHTISANVDMTFCLSYGELCATVGLMYDLFRPALTDEEQQVFFAVLDRFLMKAAVNCLERPPWWANTVWSNWNGVCAGGMGIMALAFYDDLPAARKLIPFVEKSLGEYLKSYIENGGGCLEGTGYWNYGMNYAMRYLLSWENATGEKHPAFRIRQLGQSLYFPLDFTGVTFGDNDGWGPSCFFFMLAKRMKQPSAALNAAAYLLKPVEPTRRRRGDRVNGGDLLYAADAIPTMAEMETLKKAHTKQCVPVARVFKGMDWAALSDDEAFPSLRMAVRGGSSAVTGHGMIDLLSIRCRVNGELMITDQQDGGYLPTTFTRRGHELYGRSAASKSTLLVDGLGCNTDVVCKKTEVVKGDDLLGIRVDGSGIYLPRWKNLFTGRLVLLVENSYWLVIDRVEPTGPIDAHWMESRFHTLAESKSGKNWVALKSGRERMMMTFASLGQGVMQQAVGMPSNPSIKATTIYRWMDAQPVHDNLHVVALNPGSRKLGLKLSKEKGNVCVIEVTKQDGTRREIRLSSKLKLK